MKNHIKSRAYAFKQDILNDNNLLNEKINEILGSGIKIIKFEVPQIFNVIEEINSYIKNNIYITSWINLQQDDYKEFIDLLINTLNESFGINSNEINAFFKTTESKNNDELIAKKIMEYLNEINLQSIFILNGFMNLKNEKILKLIEILINNTSDNIKFFLISDENININTKKDDYIFKEKHFIKNEKVSENIVELYYQNEEIISKTIFLDEFNEEILEYFEMKNYKKNIKNMIKNKIILELEGGYYSYNSYFKRIISENNLINTTTDCYKKIAEYFEKREDNKNAYKYYIKSNQLESALNNLNNFAIDYFKNGYYADLIEKYEIFDFTKINPEGYNYYLWSLFLSGSYHKCFYILNNLDEKSIKNNMLKLSIITLKIMSGTIKNNIQEKIKEADELIKFLPDNNNFMKLGMMLNMGNIHSNLGDIKKGIEYYKNCYFLSKNSNETFMEAVALTNYANRLYWNGDLLIAQHVLEKEITSKHFKKYGFDKILNLILGAIYYEKSNLKESSKLLKEGVEFYINNSLLGLSGISEYFLFNSFKAINDPKTAEKIYNDIIKLFSINLREMRTKIIKQLFEGIFEDKYDEIKFKKNNNILEYLLNILLIKNKLKNDDLENIEDMLEKMENHAISKKLNIQLLRINILKSIYYYKNNNKNESKKYIHKSLEISKNMRVYQVYKEFEDLEMKNIIEEFELDGIQEIKSILKTKDFTSLGIHFSKREEEIINYILNGDSNGEIAEKIYLSEGTVKWHISNIYKKANCKNRSSLIKLLK